MSIRDHVHTTQAWEGKHSLNNQTYIDPKTNPVFFRGSINFMWMPTKLRVTYTAQQSSVVNTYLDQVRRATTLLSSPNANCMNIIISSPIVNKLAKFVTFRANISEHIQ